MSSIYYGRLTVSIFGQSHAPAIGVTMDGLPAGEAVDLDELQAFLARRAPGSGVWSTTRKEGDVPEILSGLSEGYTCGSPLTAIIRNTNTRSGDYANLRDIPRPGHADYTAQKKYGGFQDAAGGGHFSGRLTAPLCIAGGICKQILARQGIQVGAHIAAIGGIPDRPYDPVALQPEDLLSPGQSRFPVNDPQAGQAMQEAIAQARADLDSLGGVIECGVTGLPAGLGDPMLDGMENRIARLIFAIPAVKGLEFGAGFAVAHLRGSENNDPFYMEGDQVRTRTNHAGGILGGITSGMPLVFRAAVKPTPSIGTPQESVSLSRGEGTTLVIKGRHDPCIVPRAVPCVEAAAAIAIYDALLEQKERSR
ncbi:MAG: chorismate synthase [Evtepia sp.]|uniref:chorismate synthase n=1 Tax=Evtepia sp. TaxID=2773933 RepID=UPI002A75DEDC|nr:chorismate synthase [Evtepia sp.]MDY3015287.1 chorismate synthase [Evtepia sp.]